MIDIERYNLCYQDRLFNIFSFVFLFLFLFCLKLFTRNHEYIENFVEKIVLINRKSMENYFFFLLDNGESNNGFSFSKSRKTSIFKQPQ